MEKVKIKKTYKHESYIMMAVSPSTFIEYGTSSQTTLCFELASLAKQWNITMELLDMVASYDLGFNDALSVELKETSNGIERTFMINADAIPALLRKLYGTGQCPELEITKEIKNVEELIRGTMEEGMYHG